MTSEPLTIRLLGQVRVQGGRSLVSDVVPGGRRGVIVLARLAVDAGVPVGTDELAAMIWPDARPAAWQASLRNVIAEVRSWFQRLDPPAEIVSSASGYLLRLPDGARVDVQVLLDAAAKAEASLTNGHDVFALELVDGVLGYVRSGFLIGVDDLWVVETRHRVDAAISTLFVAGATAALRLGQPTRAEVLATRAIEWDEVRESGHRLLIQALSASGNRGAALAAYQRCRMLLVERFGSEPDATTQALFHELLIEAPSSQVDATARPLLLIQAAGPLVGRGGELRAVDAFADATRRDGLTVVRVEGEAGIGKTRFAAEVAALSSASGVPVLYGRADDRLDVPHRPLLESIETHLSLLGVQRRRELLGPHAQHLANLLPAVRDIVPIAPPSGILELDRAHFTAAIGEVLAAVARRNGAVLILDDMQWSSRPTADLLQQIRQPLRDVALLVLVLHRSGDPTVVETDHVITLSGLEPDDIEALASSIRRGPAAPGTARAIWAETGGNPLFATEILRSDGTGPDGVEQPRSQRLRQLVRRRVATLPRATRAWLDVAAVAGLEFEPDLIRVASGLSPDAAAAALAAAEADGVVTAATTDPARRAFRHALVRQCLLDDLADDPAYVMGIHQQLGTALEALRGTSIPQLAHHTGAAAPLGDWRRAVRYGVAAARAAADALIHEDVVAICLRTLDVLAGAGDPDVEARIGLTVLLGAAQCARHDPVGNATLETAFEQAVDLGDATLAAEAALGFTSAGAAGDELAVDTRHVLLYERALDALGDGSERLRAQLLGRLSTAYSWLRDGESGRRYAQQALELAREVGDVAVVSTVLISTRRGLSGTGQPAAERAIEDELLGIAADLDDPGIATSAWLWRFESAVELGLGADLEPCLAHAADGVAQLGVPSYRYTAAYSEAARLLLRGDIDAADTAVERAYSIGGDVGIEPMVVGGIRMIQLMGVRHEQGRLGELRDELAEYFGRSGVPEWEGTVAFADAEIGRLEAVDGYLEKVFAGYESGGVRTGVGIGFAAHMASPVARVGDTARALVLYEMLLPFRGVGTYISYFTGPVDHALGLLAGTLGREADAQSHLQDAVAFCTTLGAPRWAARCAALLRA